MNKYLKSFLTFVVVFFSALLVSVFASSSFHSNDVVIEAIRTLIFSVYILIGVVASCTCLIISSKNKNGN